MPLTDALCRAAKPKPKLYKLSDGGGLQLWVQPTGAKLWRLAYRAGRRQKVLALGPYPLVALAEAREARTDAKRQILRGVDPSELRKAARAAAERPDATFASVAQEYLNLQRRNKRAPATMHKLEWLVGLAKPTFGYRRLSEIKSPDVLSVLRVVEGRERFETARRLRSTIGAIFRLGAAQGLTEIDPTLALRGVLARPPRKHHAAITDSKGLGALARVIDGFEGQPTTKAALQLLALIFPRPIEIRGAKWPEFNWNEAVWSIPPDRMKMRRPHFVPLPRQALAILSDLIMYGPPNHKNVYDFRRTALANGFQLVRVRTAGKEPVARGWPRGESQQDLFAVGDDAANTGMNCDGLRVIDIDIDDRGTVALAIGLVVKYLPSWPLIRRRPGSPRLALVYRSGDGSPKKRAIKANFGKIEILGAGQQLVVDGTQARLQSGWW